MKNKFKVGDKVKVVDSGETFNIHPDHKKYGCEKFNYGYDPKNGESGIVIATPLVNGETQSCVVRIGEFDYIISDEGLKRYNPSLTITIKPVTRKGVTYYRPQYKHKNGEIMNDLYASKSNAKRGTNKFLDSIKNEDYEIVIK